MARPIRSMTSILAVLASFAWVPPATAQPCAGDCNDDLVVGVDELILCTNVGLGRASLGDCPSCDVGRDERVTVDDLVASVGSALGLSLQGICRIPCQGGECSSPQAAANGLLPCAEGTIVQVSSCVSRADCLREAAARSALGSGMVESSGTFAARIDACRAPGNLLLVEASLSANGGGIYRTLVSLPAGAAAGTRVVGLGEVVLDPSSEAAVRLLDELGLENFTDEGVIGVIDAVTAANASTQYPNQTPSDAAEAAGDAAAGDTGVQEAIARGRVPSPTASPTNTPSASPTRTPTTSPTPSIRPGTPIATSTPVPHVTRTPPSSGVEIEIGSATTAPNSHVTFDVTLNSPAGTNVVGILTDIGFEPGARIAEQMIPMGLLAGSVSATDTGIPLDDASGLPDFGTVQIDHETISYARIDGNVLVAGDCAGGGPRIACVDDAECSGGTCEPSGRGQGGTVATQHDAGTMVLLPMGQPDCRMNPTLNKSVVFSFLPPECNPSIDCDGVRAIVISLFDVEPLPTGDTLIFSCSVHAGPASGTFPLTCEEAQASDTPDGKGLVESTCIDGEIVIHTDIPTEGPTPTRTGPTPTITPSSGSSVAIDVGSASGHPGETVRVDVTLQVTNAEVAGTENRITVSPNARILQCDISPRFDFVAEAILEPAGCEEHDDVDCVTARVLAIDGSLMPIETGAFLYSCDIEISSEAQPGSFPIVCSDYLAAHPAGQPYNGMGRCIEQITLECATAVDCNSVGGTCRVLPPTQCNNGSIAVLPPFTQTPIPATGSPTLTPTSTATPDNELEIRIGSAELPLDTAGRFDVTLHVGTGPQAIGVLNDVFFPTGVTIPARMVAATFLSADIGSDDTAIPVNDATALPELGLAQIDDEQLVYVRRDGNILAVGDCSGDGGSCADDTECAAAATCEPAGRGQNGTVPAAHTFGTSVAAPMGGPDCAMSPELEALGKDAVFSFLPTDCVPGIDCNTIRAIVISLSDLNTLPAGDTVLYSCAVQAGEEEGTFPLECGAVQVSGLPEEGLLDATCTDGQVFVGDATCGNGLLEPGEDCDDGSICLPSFQDCTDTGTCPDGERCEPVGGDGCARNCTTETIRVSSIDSARSSAVLRFAPAGSGRIEMVLSGTQGLRTGRARVGDTFGIHHNLLAASGEVPIVIRTDDFGIDPTPVGLLVCACSMPLAEPLFGPGLTATGVIGCGSAGVSNINYVVEQDHNTTPGNANNSGPENGLPDDPNCDRVVDPGDELISRACLEGEDEACSTALSPHGVCNSPRVFTYSGESAPRGATFLRGKMALSLLADAGACDLTLGGTEPCPYGDYGADCVPCTADDAGVRTIIISNPLTSGTAAATIYDNLNIRGTVSTASAGPGEPADCEALASDPDGSLHGVWVSAFGGIDLPLVGDATLSTVLAFEE